MSYTVVHDYARERRERENRVNAVMRHCRIGKVKPKPKPRGLSDLLGAQPLYPSWPFGDTDWKRSYMPKCGCKVGSVCGNAACPHLPTATC